ncbi:MAG: hypothetical protein CL959_01680 [Euryarchaeota archaeon]|nr:hypothetical protein [Euryarchaeota archaeon]|tara:strand:- start:2326 stop:2511 length:186 start_codon:yes stop_codon:yes gene_type:complete
MTGGRYIGISTIAANCERARNNAQRQINDAKPILTALERGYFNAIKQRQQEPQCRTVGHPV